MSPRDLVIDLIYHTPFARLLGPRWLYAFTPRQLCYLCSCIDRTAHLPRPILEVGCYDGATTVWLNKHMNCSGIVKPYMAIDTFAGFVKSDIDHEATTRGK